MYIYTYDFCSGIREQKAQSNSTGNWTSKSLFFESGRARLEHDMRFDLGVSSVGQSPVLVFCQSCVGAPVPTLRVSEGILYDRQWAGDREEALVMAKLAKRAYVELLRRTKYNETNLGKPLKHSQSTSLSCLTGKPPTIKQNIPIRDHDKRIQESVLHQICKVQAIHQKADYQSSLLQRRSANGESKEEHVAKKKLAIEFDLSSAQMRWGEE
ncbi:hypothetical protein KIN20_023852 [Parelaphostrongylus tenuis]|uniref:Uncharacterized protein n=1 Tax=Parelaphostrongylus tenuis TaxID=148309 RepID=A0AAD5N7L1_PARTN|nr:hypothetical protein KIN20_023852 [Parelaphostrongylus tenuis]